MAGRKSGPTRERVYVQGNTVRKMEPEKRPVRRRIDPTKPIKKKMGYRRNQEKALHMDLPYVVLLTLAAVSALSICVNYLHVQSSISTRIHHIESLERDLETVKSQNEILQTKINTSIDLEHVYRVATEELGMVYANKNQVILYDKTESEYVRQYEDIPEY